MGQVLGRLCRERQVVCPDMPLELELFVGS